MKARARRLIREVKTRGRSVGQQIKKGIASRMIARADATPLASREIFASLRRHQKELIARTVPLGNVLDLLRGGRSYHIIS